MAVKRSALFLVPALAAGIAACDTQGVPAQPEGPRSAASASPGTISSQNAAQEVTAVIQGVTKAAAARDIAALEKYYDANVQIVDFGGLTKGWSTYKSKNLSASMAQLSNTSADAHRVGDVAVQVEGNVAWAAFPYAVTADVKGTPTEIFGYGTATLRNDGTGWRIVQVQTSGRERRSYDQPL